ncbi:MAG: O-antigen/teichoic acid export membrane protein [Salibacteraceae bacterium]|jgi:O-antigen/teichoic acid export membrane protein
MSKLKKLAGQTAIYGLPSILGRFLNYLLFPLYTAMFAPEQYGIVNEIYALVAFVAVVLPWGMETAYFRFSSKKDYSLEEVFKTSLFFVALTSALFIGSVLFFTQDIANGMLYPNNPEFVIWMGLAIGFDALSVIPLAQLRQQEKAKRFAAVNFSSIGINILINLFFILYCMNVHENGGNYITDAVFNPAIGVGYIFIANMVQSLVKFVLVSNTYKSFTLRVNGELLKQLFFYASPLVLAGFAGIINETLDRRLIRVILEPTIGTEAALTQVGIYGGVYKLAVLITLFTQAFRYAAEPFFFAQEKEGDGRKVYADVMKWYTVIVTMMFLGVMLYLDIIKLLIRREAYWVGLTIVPILLFANIFLGWIYNLSVWYKLTQKTIYGALLAVIGAVITVSLNIYLIPTMGYTGAAWTTFTSYAVMAVVSYFLGQRFFPIPYEITKIVSYCAVSFLLWYGSTLMNWDSEIFKYGFNTFLMLVFLAFIYVLERKDLARFMKR